MFYYFALRRPCCFLFVEICIKKSMPGNSISFTSDLCTPLDRDKSLSLLYLFFPLFGTVKISLSWLTPSWWLNKLPLGGVMALFILLRKVLYYCFSVHFSHKLYSNVPVAVFPVEILYPKLCIHLVNPPATKLLWSLDSGTECRFICWH